MCGRHLETIRNLLYQKFGNENYLLFKVAEESNEVAHSITKLLAILNIKGLNPDEEEQLWVKVSEEFAQLEVYMELLKPYLIPGALEHYRTEKINTIAKKVEYESAT